MTPEDIKKIVNEEILNVLGVYSNVPYQVQKALELRLSTNALTTSAKTVASETQAVDEGGTDTYDVPKIHSGFVQTSINGTTIYIPYYL